MDVHCGVSMVSSITILFSVSENLSKAELIEKLITINDLATKLSDLSNRFDEFFDEVWKFFHET